MCPKRTTMRGRPPTITGSGVEDRKKQRFASWKNELQTEEDQRVETCFYKMPLRSHISVLKEYKGSYGAYYICKT